jgi:hypothetical protein
MRAPTTTPAIAWVDQSSHGRRRRRRSSGSRCVLARGPSPASTRSPARATADGPDGAAREGGGPARQGGPARRQQRVARLQAPRPRPSASARPTRAPRAEACTASSCVAAASSRRGRRVVSWCSTTVRAAGACRGHCVRACKRRAGRARRALQQRQDHPARSRGGSAQARRHWRVHCALTGAACPAGQCVAAGYAWFAMDQAGHGLSEVRPRGPARTPFRSTPFRSVPFRSVPPRRAARRAPWATASSYPTGSSWWTTRRPSSLWWRTRSARGQGRAAASSLSGESTRAHRACRARSAGCTGFASFSNVLTARLCAGRRWAAPFRWRCRCAWWIAASPSVSRACCCWRRPSRSPSCRHGAAAAAAKERWARARA